MHSLNKKKKLIIVSIIALIIVILATTRIMGAYRNQKAKYIANIMIQTIDNENNKKDYRISLYEFGNYAVAAPNFLNSEVYMFNEKTYYLDKGRFKAIISQHTYRDLYTVLKKIKLAESTVQKVDREYINQILECLFINYKVENDLAANISFENKNIKTFSLYLKDITHFKSIDIIIDFELLNKTKDSKIPHIYDEITDIVDSSALQILNLK